MRYADETSHAHPDTYVAYYHAEGTGDRGVPLRFAEGTFRDHKQGDMLATGQLVFQFLTGTGREYFVILLDWEDWDTERCPRFATYKLTAEGRQLPTWKLVAPVTTTPNYLTKE